MRASKSSICGGGWLVDADLVAKISVPRVDDKTRYGAAYPLGCDLLMTARHVIEFKERDSGKPIKIEWPALAVNIEISPKDFVFSFQGGEELDLVILHVQLPELLQPKLRSILSLLHIGKIDSKTDWECVGYPKVNEFQQQDATGVTGSDLEKQQIRLTLDDTINEQTLENHKMENGWGGMSGAPVFSINQQKIIAIITEHNQWMHRQLIGISIPWLIEHQPFFRQLVTAQVNQEFLGNIELQKRRINKHLQEIKDSQFFIKLAARLIPNGLADSPEVLWGRLEKKIEYDALELLKDIKAAIVNTTEDLQAAKKLFLLVLGLMVEPGGLEADNNLHHLRVRTPMAVEMYLATRYGVAPDLIQDIKEGVNIKDAVKGRHVIDDVLVREVGYDPQKNVEELFDVAKTAVRTVHRAVYGDEPKNELDSFERVELNETIVLRRQGDKAQLLRFEVASTDELKKTHPLHNDNVCRILHKAEWLPDLPIVHYGLGEARNEAKIRACVNEFFRIIRQYETNI